MNLWIKIIFSIGFIVLISACTKTETAIDCDVPELIHYDSDYNEFVCTGVHHMQEQKYGEAVKSFEAALAITLFEMPNFILLPQLAWAYFKVGDSEKAEDTLVKAELSLSVDVGILKCTEAAEVEDGFYLSDKYGNRLTGKNSNEVADIMCYPGVAYDYERRFLEDIPLEAESVKRYLDVKRRIEEIDDK